MIKEEEKVCPYCGQKMVFESSDLQVCKNCEMGYEKVSGKWEQVFFI